MFPSIDTLHDIIDAILPLDRARMVGAVEDARRRAGARAEVLLLSKKEARQAWDEVERLGRLLYFIKFGKPAPNATAHEVSLYEQFVAKRQERLGGPAAAATKRRLAKPRLRIRTAL
jgi:ADP-dependent phosphofructokinase/glucokinase